METYGQAVKIDLMKRVFLKSGMNTHGVLMAIISITLLSGCGRRWDTGSSPDISDVNAMVSVEEFIVTNGWDMQSNGPPFELGRRYWKEIRGLPWKDMRDEQYPAVTQNGILYVLSNPGWHHDSGGLAYNPRTNRFAPTVRGFKPIGLHWYVWFQPESQSQTFEQRYE